MDWRAAFPSVRAARRAAAREQAARETAAAEVAALDATYRAEIDELRADVVHALRLCATTTGRQPDLDAVISKLIADGRGGSHGGH